MRRHDDLLRADRPAVGNGARPLQPAHGRVLVGPQPSGRGRGKAQRVELGLALEPHGSRHRKRQRQLVRKARVEPQLLQRRKLLFQPCLICGQAFFVLPAYLKSLYQTGIAFRLFPDFLSGMKRSKRNEFFRKFSLPGQQGIFLIGKLAVLFRLSLRFRPGCRRLPVKGECSR